MAGDQEDRCPYHHHPPHLGLQGNVFLILGQEGAQMAPGSSFLRVGLLSTRRLGTQPITLKCRETRGEPAPADR